MSGMRFAYLDREGREVRLSGVDAVKAGIRHGTIGPETLLFDAEAGGWAQAECHPFFQEIMAEASEPPVSPEDLPDPAEGGEPPIQELWRFPARFDPGSEETEPEPETAGEVQETDELQEVEASAPEPSDLEEIDVKLSLPGSPEEGAGSGTAEPPSADRDPEEREEASIEAPRIRQIPGGDHLILEIDDEDDGSPSGRDHGHGMGPWEETAYSNEPPAGAGSGRDEEATNERRGVPSVRSRTRGVRTGGGLLEGGPVAAVGILVILAAVVTAAGVLRSQDEPGSVDGASVGTAGPAAPDPAADLRRAKAKEDSILDLIRPAGLAARILRAMERADADVAAALALRAARDSLPPAPPDAWLEGAYLAEASAFPAVPEYWRAMARWTAQLRGDLPGLVRAQYAARLEEGGFAGRTGDLLLVEALEDFQARADRRAAAFAPMEELIRGSLDLHELLVEWEDEIDYEPFTRDRISRDPILEAVPSNPELEEEIWSRLTRITGALEDMENLRAPTTDRLQEWLVARLRASLGSPGGPADTF